MTRMTSKGQVTIPKGVRDKLGLAPGDEVGFREDGGQMIIETEKSDLNEDAAEKMIRIMVEFGKAAKRIPMTDRELMALTRGPFDNADTD